MSESLSNLSGSTELGPESWDWKPGHHTLSAALHSSSCELLSAQISRFRKMVSQMPKKTFLGHNLLEDGGGVEREIISEYSGSQKRK